MNAADRVIVALDLGPEDALSIARSLEGTARWVKVGMTLFYAAGPRVVTELRAMGFDVFVDLKLNDIPHQVEGAAAALAALDIGMFTVHASGGAAMMEAALRGARKGASVAGVPAPKVIAVTVLTSMDDATVDSVGCPRTPAEQVDLLGRLAFEAGVDGVVCSPHEAVAMRALGGPDAWVVTPGVRPTWSVKGDQSRVTTPARALDAGASHLVVGRPIVEAPQPRIAFDRLVDELEGR